MIGSLYSGISGLKANTNAMSVIGDNIANVNTTGFKSSRASFADVLSGVTGNEIGQGVMMTGQNADWTQGAPESTGNATDLAITGDGLFVVHDSSGVEYYTRAGNFQFDNAGNLVTHDGMIVQGYKIDPVTGALGVVSNITIESGNCSPLVTSEMTVNLNLNADDTNGLDESVGSTLTVDCTNTDSDIIFTAVNGGAAGNDISIEYTDSGVLNQELSIEVIGTAITVNPATDTNGFITSTANEIGAEIAANSAAAALVTAAASVTGEGGVGITAQRIVIGGAANSDITFTAVNGGAAGNNISIEYVDPGVASQPLEIVVDDSDPDNITIKVNLATEGAGDITSTANTIVAEIVANPDASALVTAAAANGTGEGIIATTAIINILDGGGGINVANLAGGGGGAAATVDSTNDNSDVTFTAVKGGVAGNNISIKYVDPGETNQDLRINVDDSNPDDIIISVNLATGAGGAITSTASEIVAAINNTNADSALLVSATAESDGSGVVNVPAPASVNLSGGMEVSDNTPDTYSNTITAYDSLGSAVDVTVQYTCVGQGRWVWDVTPSDGLSSSTGVISFDENGKLSYPAANPTITITGLSNGAEDLGIEWDLVGNDNFTGYALVSSTSSQAQNGYAAGTLQSVSVDDEGFVVKTYSNGQLIPGYRIALAGFSSYTGLARTGDNLYSEALASGQPIFGIPGNGGLGGINSRSLEMSNVDLATEFVRMITTQRAFQANSRVITSSDEILQELINLKR